MTRLLESCRNDDDEDGAGVGDSGGDGEGDSITCTAGADVVDGRVVGNEVVAAAWSLLYCDSKCAIDGTGLVRPVGADAAPT